MLTTRPLPTAFDPPDAPTTVATPSCCCCCCCCLVTVAAASGAVGGEAYYRSKENLRSPNVVALCTIAALGLVPLSMYLVLRLAQYPGWSWFALGFYLAIGIAVLKVAGAPAWKALGFLAVVLLAAAQAFYIEMFAVLFTMFIIELAAPLAGWLGWLIARSRHRSRYPEYAHRAPHLLHHMPPPYPPPPPPPPRPPHTSYPPPPPPPPPPDLDGDR